MMMPAIGFLYFLGRQYYDDDGYYDNDGDDAFCVEAGFGLITVLLYDINIMIKPATMTL